MDKSKAALVIAIVAIVGAVLVNILGSSEELQTLLVGVSTSALGYLFGFNTYNEDLREPESDPEV